MIYSKPVFPKPKRKVDNAALERARQIPCVYCGRASPSDPCHIISRGAGGDDTDENLTSLCRTHHVAQHKLGWGRLIAESYSLEKDLESKGWVFVDGKLRNQKYKL